MIAFFIGVALGYVVCWKQEAIAEYVKNLKWFKRS